MAYDEVLRDLEEGRLPEPPSEWAWGIGMTLITLSALFLALSVGWRLGG